MDKTPKVHMIDPNGAFAEQRAYQAGCALCQKRDGLGAVSFKGTEMAMCQHCREAYWPRRTKVFSRHGQTVIPEKQAPNGFRIAIYRTGVIHTVNEALTKKAARKDQVITYCGNRPTLGSIWPLKGSDPAPDGWQPREKARLYAGWMVCKGEDPIVRHPFERLCKNCDESIG